MLVVKSPKQKTKGCLFFQTNDVISVAKKVVSSEDNSYKKRVSKCVPLL